MSVLTTERIQRRRDEILTAAYKVFAEKGYHDAGIADIAEELGVGHGTFYRYFKNKRDIFQVLVAEVATRLAMAVAAEQPAASDTLAEYREQTVRWGHRLLLLAREDPYLTRILLREALAVDDEITESVDRLWDLATSITEAYLLNGKRKGFLRPNLNTGITAAAINAMILEAFRRGVANEEGNGAAEEWITAVVNLIFDGIAK